MSDRRRILGPADAVRPAMAPRQASGERSSGVRSFFVKTGLSKNANGLAYLEVGDTIVEVSVFGPRPIRGLFTDRASLSVEAKFLAYVAQPDEIVYNGTSAAANPGGRPGLTNVEQKISTYVETALLPLILVEKYPKSTIDVFVNVISFNAHNSTLANLIAWVVNCTSLAMVDSGIEVRDLVTSGHVALANGAVETDAECLGSASSTECVASFLAMQNNDVVALWVLGTGGAVALLVTGLIDGCLEMSTTVRNNINAYLLDLAK